MKDNKDIQQKYLQLQMYSQQIKQLQKQLELLEQQGLEIEAIKQGLEDLKNVSKGSEILVPISSGIFLKAELKDNENVTVNVGSNIATVKTIDQAKTLIAEQSDELAKIKKQFTQQLEQLAIATNMIQQELIV
ncbi:prefoldin subunit alpha [Candidatus Woesearchaeota archaeon]|nr:prefoldin subunit alpha [Candidatus Woesearchaeota archaeon]